MHISPKLIAFSLEHEEAKAWLLIDSPHRNIHAPRLP
jgi:hypothetical protein